MFIMIYRQELSYYESGESPACLATKKRQEEKKEEEEVEETSRIVRV
jgi:hypothetical protein